MTHTTRAAGCRGDRPGPPRILKKKDGSERAPAKAGRLTIEDVLWLYDIIDDVKNELSDLAGPA